jgi:hypothetical protein
MSDEERRSSFASTSAGGQPQGEYQVPVSRLIEGHEQPLPSIESDTIDNLTLPTACNLILLVRRSFRMKVERGLVYPHQTILGDVQIDASSYAMVKVDMVHENLKDLKLKMPPDDTTLTMRDVVTRRVQWRRTSIDVDPSTIASASTILVNRIPLLLWYFMRHVWSLSPIQEELRPSSIQEQPWKSPIPA